jgi:hypothetical protein
MRKRVRLMFISYLLDHIPDFTKMIEKWYKVLTNIETRSIMVHVIRNGYCSFISPDKVSA